MNIARSTARNHLAKKVTLKFAIHDSHFSYLKYEAYIEIGKLNFHSSSSDLFCLIASHLMFGKYHFLSIILKAITIIVILQVKFVHSSKGLSIHFEVLLDHLHLLQLILIIVFAKVLKTCLAIALCHAYNCAPCQKCPIHINIVINHTRATTYTRHTS